jgi:hypothetical protein
VGQRRELDNADTADTGRGQTGVGRGAVAGVIVSYFGAKVLRFVLRFAGQRQEPAGHTLLRGICLRGLCSPDNVLEPAGRPRDVLSLIGEAPGQGCARTAASLDQRLRDQSANRALHRDARGAQRATTYSRVVMSQITRGDVRCERQVAPLPSATSPLATSGRHQAVRLWLWAPSPR